MDFVVPFLWGTSPLLIIKPKIANEKGYTNLNLSYFICLELGRAVVMNNTNTSTQLKSKFIILKRKAKFVIDGFHEHTMRFQNLDWNNDSALRTILIDADRSTSPSLRCYNSV